jgi:hypothetical protein
MRSVSLSSCDYDSGNIYLDDSNYFESPKLMFSYVLSRVNSYVDICEPMSWLDIGCARGEFLYWLSQNCQGEFIGVDLLEELIASGSGFLSKKAKNIRLYCNSAEFYSFERSFDVITMLGLLPCFEDIRRVIRNASAHQKKFDSSDRKSVIVIATKFNHFGVKVVTHYQNRKKMKNWQVTVTHPIEDLRDCLLDAGYQMRELSKFMLPFSLDPVLDDPVRSWTSSVNGEQKYLNGLGQFYDIDVVVATRE